MSRTYHPSWEKEFPWVTLSGGSMLCKICNCLLSRFKKHSLKMHELSAKHIQNEKAWKWCSPIVPIPPKETIKAEVSDAGSELDEEITTIIEDPQANSDVTTSPPLKEKSDSQTYSKLWEGAPIFKDWLAPAVNNPRHAFCKYCCSSFPADKKSLVEHSISRKHKRTERQAHLYPSRQTKSFDFVKHPQTYVITVHGNLGKGPFITEGKKKTTFSVVTSSSLVIIEFKKRDGGRYPPTIVNDIHCKLFTYLNQSGIPTSFLRTQEEFSYSARKCNIIPLDFVVRRIAAGSFCGVRPGVFEGQQFSSLRVEFYLKNSPTEVTSMIEDRIVDAGWTIGGIVLQRHEYNVLQKTSITAFEILEKAFKTVGCALVELKIHFGIDHETKNILVCDLDVEGNGLHLWNANDSRIHKHKAFRRPRSILQEEVDVPGKVHQLNVESKGLVVVVTDSCDEDAFCDSIRQRLQQRGIKSQMRQGSAYHNTEATIQMINEYNEMNIPIVFIAVSSKGASLGAMISANTVHSVINCPDVEDFEYQQFSGIGCPVMLIEDATEYVGKLFATSDHVIWSRERGELLANWKKIVDRDRIIMKRAPNCIPNKNIYH